MKYTEEELPYENILKLFNIVSSEKLPGRDQGIWELLLQTQAYFKIDNVKIRLTHKKATFTKDVSLWKTLCCSGTKNLINNGKLALITKSNMLKVIDACYLEQFP